MIIQTIKEGEKNISVMVKGFTGASFPATSILDLTKIKSPTSGWKGLRLDSLTWALEEKMSMYLQWEEKWEESSLILPLESRNSMRFDEGIPSPRVADGWGKQVWLNAFNVDKPVTGRKGYFILLDFDKQ